MRPRRPTRAPGHRRAPVARCLVAGSVVLALAGCGAEAIDPPAPARSGDLLLRTPAGASALAPLPGGGLRVGELDGRIRDVDRRGRVSAFARLPVARGGQRGLLGLAVTGDGRTFAASVRPAPPRRLVVEEVGRDGSRRLVWSGPRSTDLAVGGRLAVAPDGRLTIGIGDLQMPPRISDPEAINGKLVTLDPDGGPGQRPRILSGGWNNPYAFAWTPAGELWVADNSPGEQPERVARADPGGIDAPRLDLPDVSASSGVAALRDGSLAVCGYVSRRLDRIVLRAGAPPRIAGAPLATDCRLGAVQLTDGRIAYATGRAVLTRSAP